MAGEARMLRLLQGDVGSGKTVVALLAMLMAVSNGFQATLMAPTEILAEQHLTTLQALLQPLDLEVVGLTSAIKGKSRQDILSALPTAPWHSSSAPTPCSTRRCSSTVSA